MLQDKNLQLLVFDPISATELISKKKRKKNPITGQLM